MHVIINFGMSRRGSQSIIVGVQILILMVLTTRPQHVIDSQTCAVERYRVRRISEQVEVDGGSFTMSAGVVQMLHKSLEEAQKSLTSTNDAIRKLTGRDPTQPSWVVLNACYRSNFANRFTSLSSLLSSLSYRPGPGSQRRFSGSGGGRMRAWLELTFVRSLFKLILFTLLSPCRSDDNGPQSKRVDRIGSSARYTTYMNPSLV